MTPTQYQCKAVVVGTGAGGAAAAATLAEAGIDTLILEQGQAFKPAEHSGALNGLTRMYLNGGVTTAIGFPPIVLPIGKAVGGSTLINSSTCFRPPPDRVAAWGGPAYEEFEPFFAEVERRINAQVVDISLLGGNWHVMKRGCDALGVELKPLMHNIRDCKGQGRCQYGCPHGAKQSTDVTFIPSAIQAGARLLTGHRVDSLIIENGKAAGVTGSSPDGRFQVKADVVVLALGSLYTPAFLLRQHVGNASRRIGRGLHIHPATRVVAEFDERIDGYIGLPQGAFIDRWLERGVILEGIFTPPGILIGMLPGVGAEFKRLAARYRNLSAFGVMVSDSSTGRVCRGRFGHPFFVFYQLQQADAESMRFGVARLAEIYLAAGAQRVFTGVFCMPVIEKAEDLHRFESLPIKPSYFEMMAFHSMGTCAMGPDPKTSVVDFFLQSHDLPNLYVMDGSVIPSALGVNPQVTIMGLALRAAKLLAERL